MFNFINHTQFPQSPIECYKLKIVSFYFVFVLALSFLFNLGLLITFWKGKSSYIENNTFMVSLTVLNTFGCVLQLPFVILSNSNCR